MQHKYVDFIGNDIEHGENQLKDIGMIKKYSDITAEWVREYRKKKGLTLDQFWNPVFVYKQNGRIYETRDMPNRYKALIFLYWVCGIDFHADAKVLRAMVRAAKEAEKEKE